MGLGGATTSTTPASGSIACIGSRNSINCPFPRRLLVVRFIRYRLLTKTNSLFKDTRPSIHSFLSTRLLLLIPASPGRYVPRIEPANFAEAEPTDQGRHITRGPSDSWELPFISHTAPASCSRHNFFHCSRYPSSASAIDDLNPPLRSPRTHTHTHTHTLSLSRKATRTAQLRRSNGS
jgi:hypothetical protein